MVGLLRFFGWMRLLGGVILAIVMLANGVTFLSGMYAIGVVLAGLFWLALCEVVADIHDMLVSRR